MIALILFVLIFSACVATVEWTYTTGGKRIPLIAGASRQAKEHFSNQKIQVGISLYPDAILFKYALEISGLEKLNFEFLHTDWSKIDEDLKKGNLQLAYYNSHDAQRIKSLSPSSFVVLDQPITEYFGFSIFARKALGLENFIDVVERLKQPSCVVSNEIKRAAAQMVAAQLTDKTIVTAATTDHFRSVVEFFQSVSIPIHSHLHPETPESPDDALQFFLEGNGDIFIGGVTQKICLEQIADHSEMIFGHYEFVELMHSVKNTLILRSFEDVELDSYLLSTIASAWHSSIITILKDIDLHKPKIIELINNSITHHDVYSNLEQKLFQDSDFENLFDRWFNLIGIGGGRFVLAPNANTDTIEKPFDDTKILSFANNGNS